MRTESQKTCAVSTLYRKEDIFVSVEPLQDGEWMHKIECYGCAKQCALTFIYRSKLSFAFVGKLGGVFSSHCKRLVEAEAVLVKKHDGQLSLISNAEE